MSEKGKILIIDDEDVIRSLFKRLLTREGYEFKSAENGPDGLEEIVKFHPDLVFLDLKMPGMDGLEVLKKIKEINKSVPVIILTGHGDLDSAVQSVRLGAYDFMRKPVEDLAVLLIDIDRAIKGYGLIKRNLQLNEELKTINEGLESKVEERTEDLQKAINNLKLAQDQINEEIKVVSIVQQKLLPESVPKREGLDAAAIYLASAAVGGDYYDFIDMGEDKLGIVMADVSGHGLPAGFVMTMVKIMLIHLSGEGKSIKASLEAINKMLSIHIPTNNFVTMFYGVIDFKEMTFRFINAGHEPLLKMNTESKEWEIFTAKCPFLGIDVDTNFVEDVIPIKKNDKFILYTDGITEAINPKKEAFGDDRFKEVITKGIDSSSLEIATDILGALSVHCEGISYADDITLMVLGLT